MTNGVVSVGEVYGVMTVGETRGQGRLPGSENARVNGYLPQLVKYDDDFYIKIF